MRPGRYGWVLVLLAGVLVVYVTINSLRTEGPGSRGLQPGTPMPDFAAPLADSGLDGDANVATRPDQGASGEVPACSVRDPRALVSCRLVADGPAVLAFLATPSEDCKRQLDLLERARPRHPDVRFAAIAVRGDREELRRDIRRRGWRFPVAYDRDGAVANLYGVAVCPTVVFARRGGRALGSTLGVLEAPALERELRRLERAGG